MDFEADKRQQRTIHITKKSYEIIQEIASKHNVTFNRVVEQLALHYGQAYLESEDHGTD